MASGLFTVDATPGEAAKLSFAAALSVAQTCDVFTPTPLACLKWPNDVLIDGRKLAGLLLESWTVGTRLSLCVGIGVNLAHHPGGTEYPATHLDLFTQAPVAAAAFLPILIERFAGWMDRWRADGFAPIRAGWLARAAGVGGPVTVRLEGEHFSGVFEDLDETGALVVRLDNGTVRTVHAGDVFLHG